MNHLTRNFLLIFPISILLLLSACKEKEEIAAKPVIRPIRTITVAAKATQRPRTFSGIARASVETKLSFRVGGKIDRLPVKIGMRVKKGDLIALLDPMDFSLAVKQSEANRAQAEAQLTQARADYDRDRQLYEASDISRSQLDRSQAAFRSSRAQVDAAIEAARLTGRKLRYTRLAAPMAGAISAVPVEAHQTVGAGQPVAVLTSGGAMEMEMGVPESLIAEIHVGDPAKIAFDAISGRDFSAKVVEVGVKSTGAAAYAVKLKIEDGNDRLRPGMVGETTFVFKAGEAYITIPLVAVATEPSGKRFVWIYRKDTGDVTLRAVTVGKLTSRGLQILDGLSPGEIIAVRGVHRLTEGMKVKLMPATDAVKAEGAGA